MAGTAVVCCTGVLGNCISDPHVNSAYILWLMHHNPSNGFHCVFSPQEFANHALSTVLFFALPAVSWKRELRFYQRIGIP